MGNTPFISEVRHQAIPYFLAEFLTVGDHQSEDVSGSIWIAKPADDLGFRLATHIKLQALNQNIRYTIDTKPSSSTHGFQLTAGSEVLIPIPNHGLSISSETGQANIQYQWVR